MRFLNSKLDSLETRKAASFDLPTDSEIVAALFTGKLDMATVNIKNYPMHYYSFAEINRLPSLIDDKKICNANPMLRNKKFCAGLINV